MKGPNSQPPIMVHDNIDPSRGREGCHFGGLKKSTEDTQAEGSEGAKNIKGEITSKAVFDSIVD